MRTGVHVDVFLFEDDLVEGVVVADFVDDEGGRDDPFNVMLFFPCELFRHEDSLTSTHRFLSSTHFSPFL